MSECFSLALAPCVNHQEKGVIFTCPKLVFSLVVNESHKPGHKDYFPEQGCRGVLESLKENCEITLQ